jgi:hypothetical protein
LEWQLAILLQWIFCNLNVNQFTQKWFFRITVLLILCIRLSWNLATNKHKYSCTVLLFSTKDYLLEESSLILSMIFDSNFLMAAMLNLCKSLHWKHHPKTNIFWNGSYLNPLQRAKLKPYPKSTPIKLQSFLISYFKFILLFLEALLICVLNYFFIFKKWCLAKQFQNCFKLQCIF